MALAKVVISMDDSMHSNSFYEILELFDSLSIVQLEYSYLYVQIHRRTDRSSFSSWRRHCTHVDDTILLFNATETIENGHQRQSRTLLCDASFCRRRILLTGSFDIV